jgi:hypothetical protein
LGAFAEAPRRAEGRPDRSRDRRMSEFDELLLVICALLFSALVFITAVNNHRDATLCAKAPPYLEGTP